MGQEVTDAGGASVKCDLSVQTPHQAAAKSQACVSPHSSGNPRRHLLLAQVLRQRDRNSPCPSSPLGPLPNVEA